MAGNQENVPGLQHYPHTLWNASPLCRAFGVMRAFLLRCVTRFWTSFIRIRMCGFPSSSIFKFQSFSTFRARTISALSPASSALTMMVATSSALSARTLSECFDAV